MVRKIKKTKVLRRYFGELLTDREIKIHAAKSNFGTENLEEIYQKELAGHIVNSFVKWSSALNITEDMIQNLSIIKAYGEKYWAKYDSNTKTWKFRLSMGNLPIDVIDYLVLHELCHYYIEGHGEEFQLLMVKNMPDYREKAVKLQEIEELGEEWLRKN